MTDLERHYQTIAANRYSAVATKINGLEVIQVLVVDSIIDFAWQSAQATWEERHYDESDIGAWLRKYIRQNNLSGECFLRISWDEGSFHLGLFWAHVKLSDNLEWVDGLWATSHTFSLIRLDSTDCYQFSEFASTEHDFAVNLVKYMQMKQT